MKHFASVQQEMGAIFVTHLTVLPVSVAKHRTQSSSELCELATRFRNDEIAKHFVSKVFSYVRRILINLSWQLSINYVYEVRTEWV
jgi:hypothetical protein